MITREQLEEALDEKNPFKLFPDVDHDLMAITLLRERIPYEDCKSIIGGAGHDTLYLCDVDEALPHLLEDDIPILADCNVWIDSDNDCLALFV